MGESASTPERNATEQELELFDDAAQSVDQLDSSGTFDQSNRDHRLMVIAFDGTRNDRADNTTNHTNPDILEDLVPQTDTVKPIYIEGVATRNESTLEHYDEAAFGTGSEERAIDAYKDFREQVQIWHEQNPNIEVHVSTIGFSRGTGSQRHFANLVDDFGVPNPSGDGYLIEPGEVVQDTMLMYDSVVSGPEDELNLGIPDSVLNAVNFVAAHENRINFDSSSIVDPIYPDDPGILELLLPGAHSDVGGNYDYDGLSARSLGLGHQLLTNMGVPVEAIPDHYLPAPDNGNILINNSGSASPAHWEIGDREVDIFGNPDRWDAKTLYTRAEQLDAQIVAAESDLLATPDFYPPGSNASLRQDAQLALNILRDERAGIEQRINELPPGAVDPADFARTVIVGEGPEGVSAILGGLSAVLDDNPGLTLTELYNANPGLDFEDYGKPGQKIIIPAHAPESSDAQSGQASSGNESAGINAGVNDDTPSAPSIPTLREQLADLKDAATNIPEQPDVPKDDWEFNGEQQQELDESLDQSQGKNNQELDELTEGLTKEERDEILEQTIRDSLNIPELTDWEEAGVSEERWGEIQQEAKSGAQQGTTNIVHGLQNGSDTQVAIGALELLVNADILEDSFSLIDGKYVDNAQGGAQVLSSGMRLENALDADNEFAAIDAGLDLLAGLDNLIGDESLGDFGKLNDVEIGQTGVNVGTALSVVNLANVCSFSLHAQRKRTKRKGSRVSWPAATRSYSSFTGDCGTRNKLLRHARRLLPENDDYGRQQPMASVRT